MINLTRSILLVKTFLMKNSILFFSVAFSGFLVYLFDKIWGSSIDWTKIKTEKFGEFLTRKINVYQLLIFVIIAILIFLIGKQFIKPKKQFYSKRQRLLRKFNKTIVEDSNILLRWNVYFDINTPFITDLIPYCNKHGEPPLRFIHNHCPVDGCENSRIRFNESEVKNAIESELIHKWEKINS